MATCDATTDTNDTATAWRDLSTEYEAAQAALSRAQADCAAAEAAFAAEVGNPDPDFERYGAGVGLPLRSRDEHIRFVETKIALTDYSGQELTADAYAVIARKAAELVDAYAADREMREAALKRLCEPAETKWEAALDRLCAVRIALWRAPAPDAASVLLKLDTLAQYMAEGNDDLAAEVAAIRDDARRLLPREA